MHGRLVLHQLLLQFGDFENGEQLALLHVRAVIDVELLHVAGHFGVHVDFLKRQKLRGDFERAGDVLALHLHNGRHRRGIRGFGLAGIAAARRA